MARAEIFGIQHYQFPDIHLHNIATRASCPLVLFSYIPCLNVAKINLCIFLKKLVLVMKQYYVMK